MAFKKRNDNYPVMSTVTAHKNHTMNYDDMPVEHMVLKVISQIKLMVVLKKKFSQQVKIKLFLKTIYYKFYANVFLIII